MTAPLDLLGVWTLRRRAHDRRAGVHYAMSGTLMLERDGSDVRWCEVGELRWADGRADVTRDYLLVRDDAGWEMRFADGRPFHRWTPGRLVEHPCRADLYRGLVSVDASGSRLRVCWDVVGPAKDQRIVSRAARTGRLDGQVSR